MDLRNNPTSCKLSESIFRTGAPCQFTACIVILILIVNVAFVDAFHYKMMKPPLCSYGLSPEQSATMNINSYKSGFSFDSHKSNSRSRNGVFMGLFNRLRGESGNGKSDLLSFGKRLDINVKLPTRERYMAEAFLEDPSLVVTSTWEKDKIRRIGDNKFVLQLIEIPIPGMDVVLPEVEVVFENIDGIIYMHSGNWTLRGQGSGEVLKDSRFMKSFDFSLKGELRIVDGSSDNGAGPGSQQQQPLVVTGGWVQYDVQGRMPRVLRVAPSFVLDGVINFIQSRVVQFVLQRFSNRMIEGYREFADNVAIDALPDNENTIAASTTTQDSPAAATVEVVSDESTL